MTHNPAGSMRAAGEAGIGRKAIPTPEKEAAGGTYKTKDGHFYIPSVAFRNSMVAAGRGQRIAKFSAEKIAGASVFVTAEEAVLVDPHTGEPLTSYEVDIRRVVVQKSAVMRARPRFD